MILGRRGAILARMAAKRVTNGGPLSKLEEAIRAVGGPSKASHLCDVSVNTVYRWKELGFISSGKQAVLLAQAAKRAGVKLGVEDLVGLP